MSDSLLGQGGSNDCDLLAINCMQYIKTLLTTHNLPSRSLLKPVNTFLYIALLKKTKTYQHHMTPLHQKKVVDKNQIDA